MFCSIFGSIYCGYSCSSIVVLSVLTAGKKNLGVGKLELVAVQRLEKARTSLLSNVSRDERRIANDPTRPACVRSLRSTEGRAPDTKSALLSQ